MMFSFDSDEKTTDKYCGHTKTSGVWAGLDSRVGGAMIDGLSMISDFAVG